MSGTYYTREPGAEGEILSGEGTAPGVGLDQLLDVDRPPLRAALEIGSAVADILCIAAEDHQVHGDIRPVHVKVDEQGAVSIEGYGIVRRVTRAPGGQPDQPAADIYGLGLVMHASLSKEGLGTLPNDADGHDDAVVDRVLAMDFSAVSAKRWLAEVREFLCKILAFDPSGRPPALDAANVLATVAGQCPGDDIATWAKRAHLRQQGGRPPARQVQEDLAGPVALSGYFKKGEHKDTARKAPSSKGESTAMWSREKLAAMFAEEDEEDDRRSAARAREQSSARPREDLDAARPVVAPMPAAPSRPPPAPPPMVASADTRPSPSQGPRAQSMPSSPSPAISAGAPAAKPSVVQPMRAPIVASVPDEPDEEPKGSNTMVIVGVVAVLLIVLCGGGVLLSGGGYWFMARTPGTASTDVPSAVMATDKPADKPADTLAGSPPPAATSSPATPAATTPAVTPVAPSTAVAAPSAPVAAPPAAAPAASHPTTTTAPASSHPSTTAAAAPTTSHKPTSAPAAQPPAAVVAPPAAPAPAPSTASYPVKFSVPGREGKIRCGDGQTAEFAGATTLSFSGTVTCLVQIDKGRGAVQVGKSTTVTCSEDNGKVTCTGGS